MHVMLPRLIKKNIWEYFHRACVINGYFNVEILPQSNKSGFAESISWVFSYIVRMLARHSNVIPQTFLNT